MHYIGVAVTIESVRNEEDEHSSKFWNILKNDGRSWYIT